VAEPEEAVDEVEEDVELEPVAPEVVELPDPVELPGVVEEPGLLAPGVAVRPVVADEPALEPSVICTFVSLNMFCVGPWPWL